MVPALGRTKRTLRHTIIMFQYTADNHFKFGYNKIWYIDRVGPKDKWSVEYGRAERPVQNFRIECIAAASRIYEQREGLPIDILFSGGSDSEIVLRSFLELKIPMNVHIMRYDNYVNAHDWSYAYVICQNLNIKPIFHDLDLVKFWESGDCMQYADVSKCVSPQLLAHMWLMDQVDGIPVMGSGESYTARLDISGKRTVEFNEDNYGRHTPWVLYEREKIASWYRYPMKKGRPAVPGFFQYSPELMLSFLTDDISLKLHANECVGKLSNKSSKFDIYRRYWPELIDRKKWSGFETVLDFDRPLRQKLRSLYKDYEYEYWSEVDQLVKYMNYEIEHMPPNFSPNITNPGFRGVLMESLKEDLGDYLVYDNKYSKGD